LNVQLMPRWRRRPVAPAWSGCSSRCREHGTRFLEHEERVDLSVEEPRPAQGVARAIGRTLKLERATVQVEHRHCVLKFPLQQAEAADEPTPGRKVAKRKSRVGCLSTKAA